jgi:hypothetical protein
MNYLRTILTIMCVGMLPGIVQASDENVLVRDMNAYFGELARARAYNIKGETQNAQETFERAQKQLEGIKNKINSPKSKSTVFDYVSKKLPRIKTTAGGTMTANFDDWLAQEQAALEKEISELVKLKSPRGRTVSNVAPLSPVAGQGMSSPRRRMTAAQSPINRRDLPLESVKQLSPTSPSRAMSPSRPRVQSPARKVTFGEEIKTRAAASAAGGE